MNDLLEGFDSDHEPDPQLASRPRKLTRAVWGLLRVLATIIATLLVGQIIGHESDPAGDSAS